MSGRTNHRTIGGILRCQERGFALVITLCLLVLLLVVAVGLLTLSSTTLRSTSQQQAMSIARANAQMALVLALGELQKECGPDRRITASAAILANDAKEHGPDAVAFDPRTVSPDFANPHWLGIWDSWNAWLNGTRIDKTYQKGRESRFRRWLVSHPEPASLTSINAPMTAASGTKHVAVVGNGTLGADSNISDHVSVPLVPVTGPSTSGYAWWVSGDNQRALANHYISDAAPTGSPAAVAQRLADQPAAGVDWLDGLQQYPAADKKSLAKSISLPSLGLAGNADAFRHSLTKHYHDLTAFSIGLPVNVRDGMLKNDLNLLLEQATLPDAYGTFRRANFNGTIVPIRAHEGNPGPPFYPQDLNFPSWYKLHQYYQLAAGTGGYGEEAPEDCAPVPFQKGLWWNGNSPTINFNWHIENLDYFGWGRTPIVARAMLVFSLRRTANATNPANFDFKMGYNPVIVLWNPYNVTLASPRLWIQITPGALEFNAYVGGTARGWQPLARADGGWELFNIYPMTGPGLAAQTVPIVLKPGETRIFSALANAVSAADFRYVELYPGYEAPTANGGFDVALPGLVNLPAGTRVELAMRMSDNRNDHGGDYQNYWTVRNAQTGESQRYNEIALNPVLDGKPIQILEDAPGKRLAFTTDTNRLVFANFQLVLKSGQDLRNPGGDYAAFDARGKNFIHSKPWNNRAMYGEPTPRMKGMAQYDLHIEVGAGNQLNPDFDSKTNRSYIASAISAGGSQYPGQTMAPMTEIPLVAPVSLAGFMHFRLNPGDSRDFASGRHLWQISTNDSLGIGSSFANPLIAGSAIYADVPDAQCRGGHLQMQLIRDCYDHVFLNNDALWDRWFCSGITSQQSQAFGSRQSAKELARKFLEGTAPLAGSHYLPSLGGGQTASQTLAALFSGTSPTPTAHKTIAKHLIVQGAFNVNSTAVDAWKTMLAGLRDSEIRYVDPESGTIKTTSAPADKVVLSRFALPNYPKEGTHAGDPASWGGVRLLTHEQIDRLARECVRQVRLRGPFLNMADFINRRLDTGQTGLCGALQAAIDWDEFNGNSPAAGEDSINGRYKGAGDMITQSQISSWGLNFPAAGVGSRWTGIPGYVTQADLLKRIGNMLCVRDDTFRIRSYGEARDSHGNVTARAWGEATVFRTLDYLDAKDQADTPFANLTRNTNKTFGRRFKVLSFRWLQPDEI
ncbi:MAG: hypothetical protein NTW21_14520 [Verrucomicrobia bacterium]|nr:hypothetical protein [Verrucomicrobiota bacterium]